VREGTPESRRVIDPAAAARLIEHVFYGDDSLYLLLDAARDPAVYGAVRSCGVPSACLYDGKLPPALAEVAPYVVELRARHPFTRRVLAEGWGGSWGCLVGTPVALPDLRRHLRRFLRVETEDQRKLLFRFYDPRVLRRYLPTCTPDELGTFFGPITRFVTEDEGGRVVLSFERHGPAVSFARVPLAPS
jgi:hypothetical protein